MKPWLFVMAMVLMVAGGAKAAQKAAFLYAATDAGTIHQFRVVDTGALQPLTPPSLRVAAEAIQLVLHPSGRFAYAITVHERDSGHADAQVFGYRIGPSGTLTPVASQYCTLASPADGVTMDPKGQFLFVSGENDRLFTFRIQHDGSLTPLADNKDVPTFHIDTQADGGGEATGTDNWSSLTFDPTGHFLYLFTFQNGFDSRSYSFRSYRLDARGVLHPFGPFTSGPGEINGCFSTHDGSLFVARRHGADEGTYGYHIGPRGLLTPASPPVLPNQFAVLVTEGLGGETLWTDSPIDPWRSTLASYRIGRGGQLTRKAAHMGVWPWGKRLRAGIFGRFLYATDYEPGDSAHKPQSSLLGFAATPQETLKALATPPQPLDGRCVSLVVASGPVSAGK